MRRRFFLSTIRGQVAPTRDQRSVGDVAARPAAAAGRLGLLLFAPLLAAAIPVPAPTSATGTPSPSVREIGALVLDGIPEASPAIRQAIHRYQNTRSASFQGWLGNGSLLIRTRFGQTAQIHRVDRPGGARTQLTFFEEPARNATVSPTGDRYIVARDSGGTELYQGLLVRADGGDLAFTKPGTRNDAFVFSRDGRRIAWTQATPGQANWDVMIMDHDDPRTKRIVAGGLGVVAPLDFSPDGRRLLLHRYISATSSKRYVLDLGSGDIREINPTEAEISYVGGRFASDSRRVFTLSDQNSEFTRLVSFDLGTGEQKTISPPDLAWDVEGYDLAKLSAFDISSDGRRLAYSINDDGRSRLVVLDLRTGRNLPVPNLPDAILSRVRFSPNGRKIGMTVSTPDAESDVWSWDVDARKLERWTYSEMGGLRPTQLPSTELVRFKSFDGLAVPAFVYRSKTPRPGRRPVLVLVHGGPEAQMRPGFDSTIAYYADALGMTVIAPNIRGSTGYGRTFTKLDNGRKREDSVRDIGALLDWIAKQPDLDPGRVVVYGASYGGYVALASLAMYDQRIAGAIDEVGISNWSSFLTNTEGYRRDGRRAEYGDERDPQMKAFFERISPLSMTDRMTKPMLVIQGANDPRVPKSEADQIVAKLRSKGNEVWYLLARDEGHGFRKKTNQDAALEAQTLFLRKTLALTDDDMATGAASR